MLAVHELVHFVKIILYEESNGFVWGAGYTVKTKPEHSYNMENSFLIGECWGGNGFLFNVGGPSEHCIDEENEPCNMMTSKACAGEQRTLFVYNVAT